MVRSHKQIEINSRLFVQIETGFLCEIGRGDGTRAICLLVGFFSSSARFLNVENSCQRRLLLLLLCLVPRRVRFARPWTQASKAALTVSSLAEKRRAEPLHLTFFQSNIRAHHDTCVFRMRRSHERRSLRALLFFVARSALASTVS